MAKPILWDVFFENSSSGDALVDFAERKISVESLKKDCWDHRAKSQVDRLRRMNVGRARALAKAALVLHVGWYKANRTV